MSTYRISKGGREFTATRIESLERLAVQGHLRPDDLVSVDGGDFATASAIPGLEAFLEQGAQVHPPEDDPWRHWPPGDDLEDEDEAGSILTSFLDRLEPAVSPSTPRRADAAPTAGKPGGQEIAPGPTADLPDPAEPEMPDPAPVIATPPEPDAISLDGPVALEEPRRPPRRARRPAPLPTADQEPSEAPVTYTEWLETQGGRPEDSPLKGLGRYDNGIEATGPRRRRGVDRSRAAMLVLVCAALIAGGYLCFKPVEEERPSESETSRTLADDPPSVDLAAPTSLADAPPEAQGLRDVEERLRQGLEGKDLIEFGTSEELEDALFQELANQGASPQLVQVEPLRARRSRDVFRRRPTRANLVIRLHAVPGQGDAGLDQLQERLILSWLLVGRYMALGEITFEEVEVLVAPPLRWNKRYEGQRLAAFWQQKLESSALFLDEP